MKPFLRQAAGTTFVARLVRVWIVVWLGAAAFIYSFGPHIRVRPEYISTYPVLGRLLGGLALFDASNYLTIATHGYEVILPGLKAFFPLYPFILWLAGQPFRLVASPPMAFIIGALIVNITCLSGAVYLLKRLVRLDQTQNIADKTVILLLAWPFSFFFLAPYTEALFLLLVVGTLYAARKANWWLAGSLAALASATRLPGVLLGLALAVEYLDQHQWRRRKLGWQLLWIGLAPLGTVAYFVYLQIAKGSYRAYFEAYQASWPDRHFTLNFLVPIARPVTTLVLHHHLRPNDILGLVSVAVAVVGLWLAVHYRVRRSYVVLMIANFILPLLSGSLDSVGRYYMLTVPLFICLAVALDKRPRLYWPLVTVSAVLSLGLMTMFVAGIFVG